jgi:predicted MPP superfamily phosphohydrolase
MFPFAVARLLCAVASPYFLYLSNLLFSFVMFNLLSLINSYLGFFKGDLNRVRKWWLIATLVFIVAEQIIGYINFQFPRVVNIDLEATGVPRQNRELRVLLASDLHLGYIIGKSRFKKWVRFINSQKPDIVLLAGDICDNVFPPILHQGLHEEFNLLTAKFGVFAVTGNHEHMAGNANALEAYLTTKTNVHYLRDTAELVDNSFYVVGRDDVTNRGRPPLAPILAGLDRSRPVILIDHQPVRLKEAADAGVALQVSGHTHAGQFFPACLFVGLFFENSYGYSKKGNTHVIVSSGLGAWGPQCRFGTTSEIVNIRLRY